MLSYIFKYVFYGILKVFYKAFVCLCILYSYYSDPRFIILFPGFQF